ncbi:Hsp20/alpha crystallin family protein, partial [Candidatus Nomurabacteria bacterium]|nr:Hsp20/alpha crystallin family protein [Candidatus Nomurabacteria bacterium]
MSSLVRWDPFAELSTLQKQFFGDDFMSAFKGVNIPTTDVYTKDDELVVEAHLPNFEQKDVNIQVDGNSLVISAERHEKEED